MYYVYVLKSKKDGKRYIGFTSDIKNRLKRHNAGSVSSTKNRRPFEMLYFEPFSTKEDALEREKFFKSKVGCFRLIEILNDAG